MLKTDFADDEKHAVRIHAKIARMLEIEKGDYLLIPKKLECLTF